MVYSRSLKPQEAMEIEYSEKDKHSEKHTILAYLEPFFVCERVHIVLKSLYFCLFF